MGVMDARTLARLARVNIGTFNVWAHRGFLPGLDTGVRGRPRNITPSVAVKVLIFAELVAFGFSPTDAFVMTSKMQDAFIEEGFLIIPRARPGEAGVGTKGVAGAIIHERDPARIARATARLPPIFLVINVSELAQQIHAAEAQWLESRGAKN